MLVGEQLRLERQRQGLDLLQIAARLCINSKYLNAIEADDWKSLPGVFFSRSFVHQYAVHLGMPRSQFDAALDSLFGAETEVESSQLSSPKAFIHVPPMPTASHRTVDKRMLVSIGALAIVVLGCAGLYAAWQKLHAKEPYVAAEIPAASAAKRQGGDRDIFSPKPVIPSSAKAEAAKPASPAPSPARKEVNAVPVMQATSGLQVAATEPTWMEVTVNGKMVFVGVMERGQSQELRNPEAARILVGNAGGVAMRLNGKDIGPIGLKGQVRRVVFTKASYEIQFPGSD